MSLNARVSERFSFKDVIEGFQFDYKQGSDLIDLRLTWREMEGLIFEDFWRFLEKFEEFSFVEEKKIKNFHQAETLLFWWPQRPPQPPRSNMTSDLESLVQTSYATIFVWTV